MTGKEFVEAFLRFEKENKLFDWKIKDIYVWQYIRYLYFINIRSVYFRDIKTFSDPADVSYKGKLTLPLWIDKNIRRNDRFVKNKDVLLISHSRKTKLTEGIYKDSYTYWIDKNIKRSHVVLDRNAIEGSYVCQESHNLIDYDLHKYMKTHNVSRPNIKVPKTEVLNRFITPIEKIYGIELDVRQKNQLLKIINNVLSSFDPCIRYYEYLLDKIRPKMIIFPVGYDIRIQFMTYAAHKRNIPVAELEHGMITDVHIAYNFPEDIRLQSFPDYIFSFGNYEKTAACWPISTDNVLPVGYPELEMSIKHLMGSQKKQSDKKKIVFISSEFRIMDDMVKKLSELLDPMQFKVVYRLHPKETTYSKSVIYPFFSDTAVSIEEAPERSLHETLYEADWIVGMTSTALFESTLFDARIAIIDHPLSEGSKPLYESGRALLVNTIEELAERIKADDFIPDKSITFFETDSMNRIENYIDRIVGGDREKEQAGTVNG